MLQLVLKLKEYGRPCGREEVCCKPSNSTTSRVESREIPTSTEATKMATGRPRISRPKPIDNSFRSSTTSNRPTDTPMTVEAARGNTSHVAAQQRLYNIVPITPKFIIHQKPITWV